MPVVGLGRIDRDNAVVQLFLVVVSPQQVVQDRKVAQDFKVSRVKLGRSLEISQAVIPFSLASINVSGQRKDFGIIR